MGNRKKLVLASLVGVMMMLSFAIGLVPSQLSGPPLTAKAAPGATEVAISADGVTPVGDNFSIPVGGEQSFTALSVTNGAGTHLIPTGEASWSLATDGAAALSAVTGDFVATVSALAPGEAGLYVSTGDGLSDLVNLTLYNLRSAKTTYGTLDSVTITHPKNNTTLHVPTGATGIPLTLTSTTNNPANTAGVAYSDSNTTDYGSSATPPYAVVIPDVTALAPTATITAVASSIAKYVTVEDSITITIQADNADGNGDGLPDDPFGLGLGEGEEWVSDIDTGAGHRHVHVAGLGVGAKAIDIPTGGVTVSIADPGNPARVVTVTVPPNLLAAGQSGLLVVETADDITTLLGATQAANVNAEPAGGLVTGGQYVEIGILVSSDGGTTFAEIDNAALATNPLTLEIQGLGVLAGDNVRLFDYPTTVTNGNPIGVTADGAGAWTQLTGGTQVEDGKMTAELTSLSMFAPYSTPSAIHLFGVNNTSVDPNVAGAKAYSVNGGSIDVTVDNLPAGSVTITIDGVTATQTNVVGNVITITAPNAAALAAPANSNDVDIRIVEDADATNFDVSPKGFRYVGPILTSVAPPSGSHNGGEAITITGSGFGLTATADIGGAAVTSPSVVNATTITGVTGSHTAGNFTLTVTLSNNYRGTADGLYSYTPDPPTLDSVFPNTVYTDGGYMVKATGTNFIDPNAQLKAAAQTYGLFTATKGVQDPSVDRSSIAVEFIDDTHMNLITPQVVTAGNYDVYMATGLDVATAKSLDTSGMVDFNFVDPASATMHITSITPNHGPQNGGTPVAISGDGFPAAAGGDITSGNVLRVANAFAANGTIVNIGLSLFRGNNATQDPAAIDATVTFSTSVLTARNGGVADPAFVADALLGTWYSKTASVSAATAGQINLVISGGTTEITTFDNQRFGGTPTDQQNPFPLGIMRFDVVGATNDTTIVHPQDISMADHLAASISLATGQDGFFNVGTSAATPPPANVYFGANQAALDTSKLTQSATQLYVIAPAGDLPSAVDVMVVNPQNTADFAISRANQVYSSGGGYTYELVTALTVNTIDPANAWAFGGTVAHITGTKFEVGAKAVSQVLFGTAVAELAPAPYVSTSTDLYVIVPPLANPSATLASPTQAVDVTVTNSDSEQVVKPNFFTYNLFNKNAETLGAATGDVYTTGFAFTRATGTDVAGQKVALSDDASTAATFAAPAGIIAAKADELALDIKPNTGTLSTQVFGLVRATKVPGVFGVEDLPGTDIANIWNFDIHLYSGDYPFDEINVSFNTDETPITLRYPTDDTTLPLATNSATLSTYSHDSTFAYDFPSGTLGVSAPAIYQSNVLPDEEVVTAGNITEVTARLYHLSALALRKDAAPPVITCDLEGPDREANEGDTIDLTGQGLGWIRGIEVLTDGDVDKSVTSVLAGTITSDEFNASFRFPRVQADADGPAQLRITVNDGTPAGSVVFVNGLTVKATPTRNDLWKVLLGLLAALIGLAGGGDHGDGGGGPCFIATAAYGTPMAAQIDTLRDFRDAYLLNNAVGSAFVDAYYHVSPAVADVVAKSPVMAAAVRIVLVPVLLLAKLALAVPHVTIALSLLTGLAMYLRRLKKATKA